MTADAFAVALATERTRTARLFNLFRFVGVSAFFALTLLMGVVLENPGWVNNDWILFAAYWVASGVLLWLGVRSEAVARWSGLSIPLMDMPAVFLLMSATLVNRENSGFVVGGAAGLYVLLIIGAMARLDAREVVASGAVATVLYVALQRRIGIGGGSVVYTMLMMTLAAAGCMYVKQPGERATKFTGNRQVAGSTNRVTKEVQLRT
jgi:hypothetical protein